MPCKLAVLRVLLHVTSAIAVVPWLQLSRALASSLSTNLHCVMGTSWFTLGSHKLKTGQNTMKPAANLSPGAHESCNQQKVAKGGRLIKAEQE
eukprot:2923903-Amphidinium_carterae.1